jgi:hypothetical protein
MAAVEDVVVSGEEGRLPGGMAGDVPAASFSDVTGVLLEGGAPAPGFASSEAPRLGAAACGAAAGGEEAGATGRDAFSSPTLIPSRDPDRARAMSSEGRGDAAVVWGGRPVS